MVSGSNFIFDSYQQKPVTSQFKVRPRIEQQQNGFIVQRRNIHTNEGARPKRQYLFDSSRGPTDGGEAQTLDSSRQAAAINIHEQAYDPFNDTSDSVAHPDHFESQVVAGHLDKLNNSVICQPRNHKLSKMSSSQTLNVNNKPAKFNLSLRSLVAD